MTFTDWRRGLPWRIDLFEAGVSALQPHALAPLRWDPARRAYHG